MFVYCVKNKINNKEYVGLTSRCVKERWRNHCLAAYRKGEKEKYPFYRAIRKYGKENFDVFVLEICDSIEDMKESEIKHIKERKTFVVDGGYNSTLGGDGSFGRIVSETQKKKNGDKHRGKTMSLSSRKKMSDAKKGMYSLGNHPKSKSILVNGEKTYNCIKEFVLETGLKYASVVSSLNRNDGKTNFNGYLIERL